MIRTAAELAPSKEHLLVCVGKHRVAAGKRATSVTGTGFRSHSEPRSKLQADGTGEVFEQTLCTRLTGPRFWQVFYNHFTYTDENLLRLRTAKIKLETYGLSILGDPCSTNDPEYFRVPFVLDRNT